MTQEEKYLKSEKMRLKRHGSAMDTSFKVVFEAFFKLLFLSITMLK